MTSNMSNIQINAIESAMMAVSRFGDQRETSKYYSDQDYNAVKNRHSFAPAKKNPGR